MNAGHLNPLSQSAAKLPSDILTVEPLLNLAMLSGAMGTATPAHARLIGNVVDAHFESPFLASN
jgi:hypothetical protein